MSRRCVIWRWGQIIIKVFKGHWKAGCKGWFIMLPFFFFLNFKTESSYRFFFFTFTYSLTARVVGAPQMTSQPVSSILPCSPLPSRTLWTPSLSIPWCCLPTSSSVCLVFFPFSLCLARRFWADSQGFRGLAWSSQGFKGLPKWTRKSPPQKKNPLHWACQNMQV